MQPNEDQDKISVSTNHVSGPPTKQDTSATDQPILTSSGSTTSHSSYPQRMAVFFVVVFIILLLAGAVAFAVYHSKQNTKSPSATSVKSSTTQTASALPSVTTDTWTGQGTKANWSDPSNWSNGVPRNNADLVFNIELLNPSLAVNQQGDVPVNNDLTNLILHNITFTGSRNWTDNTVAMYEITGNTFSISDGVTNNSNIVATINPTITLTQNQTFGGTSPPNGPMYNKIYVGTLIISKYDVTFATAVGVNGAINGSGTIEDSGLATNGYDSDFGTDSPQFTGQLIIDAGGQVNLATDSASSHPLGTAKLVIDSGGQLLVNGTTINLTSTLTIAGSGLGEFSLDPISSSNTASGAIEMCGTTLNISGITNLTNNTVLGGCVDGAGPHTINLSGGVDKNNYTISAIPNTDLSVNQ